MNKDMDDMDLYPIQQAIEANQKRLEAILKAIQQTNHLLYAMLTNKQRQQFHAQLEATAETPPHS